MMSSIKLFVLFVTVFFMAKGIASHWLGGFGHPPAVGYGFGGYRYGYGGFGGGFYPRPPFFYPPPPPPPLPFYG